MPYLEKILHRLKKMDPRVKDHCNIGGQVKENISNYLIETEWGKTLLSIEVTEETKEIIAMLT